MPIKTKTCEYCGIVFNKPYSESKKVWRKRKYCSKQCHWESMKGKSFYQVTDEERENRRSRMTGELNPMWKGGDSDKERRNSAYKSWRIKVFNRDGFVCQRCGYYNGCGEKRRDLHAHHIVRWIDSFELRYEVDNGLTLCVPCHIKEHTDG